MKIEIAFPYLSPLPENVFHFVREEKWRSSAVRSDFIYSPFNAKLNRVFNLRRMWNSRDLFHLADDLMENWVFLRNLLFPRTGEFPSVSCTTVIIIIVFADNYSTGWVNNLPGILLIDWSIKKRYYARGEKTSRLTDGDWFEK